MSELRINWHALLSASIGIGLGAALTHYTMSLFGPPLLAEFGWSKAQFALGGSLPILGLFFAPFAGRFTDRFGARAAAMVGFTALPLSFVGFATMNGNLALFFAIWIGQSVFGILTTSLVFCRVIVERFDRSRGLALSLLISAPPLAGAILAPTLGALIEAEGWRAGFLALAALSGAGGLIAIVMMGRLSRRAKVETPHLRLTGRELRGLLRHPTFLLIVGGMFLVNVPQVFASSQLKLIVMDSGVGSGTATWMMSLYAIGVIVGRLLSGFALDRLPAHMVAIAILGLPAGGYLVFASGASAVPILCLAITLIGFAQGAEADIGAILISRRFDIKNFSLLLSLVTASIGVGAAAGSVVLSVTQGAVQSYGPFLLISAVATVLGAAAFWMTGSRGARLGTPDAFEDKRQAVVGEIS